MENLPLKSIHFSDFFPTKNSVRLERNFATIQHDFPWKFLQNPPNCQNSRAEMLLRCKGFCDFAYSFVWCLIPSVKNVGTFRSQVKISKGAKDGDILTQNQQKIAITFEWIVQFCCPLRFRMYKTNLMRSILWLKAPSSIFAEIFYI